MYEIQNENINETQNVEVVNEFTTIRVKKETAKKIYELARTKGMKSYEFVQLLVEQFGGQMV